MTNNSLVLCGGTGAHVALAFARLHTLGYPLGFFRRPDGKPLVFPRLYLVDQDSGDGDHEATAWQLVRRLVANHPGRFNWEKAIGRSDPPDLKIVTPLPVGPDRAWFEAPYDTVGYRFADSPWLELLFSRAQCDIRFSLGMMGSPAVGSLLFRLKEFDTAPAGLNHDSAYQELLTSQGRIVVAGSAVGGTGASVGPTLAQRFAKPGTDVMAVMLLNWFQFDLEGLDEEKLQLAQLRERSMRQNANSAFAFYGDTLAHNVATVPVGMPETSVKLRRYTSDTRQPVEESFIHGVAALCCLDHFLAAEPRVPGLYQMGSEDPTRLGGSNRVPGGSNEESLQTLADLAETFAKTLEAFAETLGGKHSSNWLQVVPAIHTEIAKVAVPERTGNELSRLAAEYREHLTWMKTVLGVEPEPSQSLFREHKSRSRLKQYPLPQRQMDDATSESQAALALFHWTADWVNSELRDHLRTPPARSARGGYWPPLVGEDSLNFSVGRAGQLVRAADHNISDIVKGFVDEQHVAEKGWPHPLAAADYFEYAIAHGYRVARRQLEMLLAGIVDGRLTLRDVEARRAPTLSLDELVKQERSDKLEDLANVEIVYSDLDGDVVLGFSSPRTLLCPVPSDEADEVRERAWRRLWEALTGSQRPNTWRTEEISEWRMATGSVRQIRTWILHAKESLGGEAPPWTQQIFNDGSTVPNQPYGSGRKLTVHWGKGDNARSVQIPLPTRELGIYWPDKDTQLIGEDEFLARVPNAKEVRTDSGISFKMVSFEVPESETPVRAFWKEHLAELQKRGDIAAFGSEAAGRRVALQTPDRRVAAILDNVIVLDRNEIRVGSCSPMRQHPVPGSSTKSGSVLYPDYPLRSDFLGLLENRRGDRIVELLKRGVEVHASGPSISGAPQSPKAEWILNLAGRDDEVSITLPIPSPAMSNSDDHEAALHRAHWMVWPKFRSSDGELWRAYYVYDHCTDVKLRLSTLWLDPDAERRVMRSQPPSQPGSRPVRFETGERRAHIGGPPIAFSLQNSYTGQEVGLYLINLKTRARQDSDIALGVDFGTSHTVASVEVGGKKSVVELPPEFAKSEDLRLTLHVSENWSHVDVDSGRDGLRWRAGWLPTYDREALPEFAGQLPSELLTNLPLPRLVPDEIGSWQPGLDYVIPYMDMQREDLADHLLADFKWDASAPSFRGQEAMLREIYLGMVIELVMADVIWQQVGGIPRRADFTFTYPLRTSAEQLKSFQRSLRKVLDSGARSLGIELRLVNGVGIFDESSAAKGGTRVFGEVCLVGDLGGGTLDLLISANNPPGLKFEEVADSARIGGNELLRTMAERSDRYLPQEWAVEPPLTVETQLRAWMRSKGMQRLLGDTNGKAEYHDGLKLRGFERADDAKPARELIERYFRLIVEYMARNLVAFLARNWYLEVLKNCPENYDKLKVLVRLRGNGWRLWFGDERYSEIQEKIAGDVGARVRELWSDRAAYRDPWREYEYLWRQHDLLIPTSGGERAAPGVGAPTCSPDGLDESNPKAAPIQRVVGKAQRREDIRSYWHSLVELVLLIDKRSQASDPPSTIRWFDRLPVRTAGSTSKVEFHRVEPPMLLSHPRAVPRQEIDDLEQELKRQINENLEEQGVTTEINFEARIAAFVWEAVFRSKAFLEGKP